MNPEDRIKRLRESVIGYIGSTKQLDQQGGFHYPLPEDGATFSIADVVACLTGLDAARVAVASLGSKHGQKVKPLTERDLKRAPQTIKQRSDHLPVGGRTQGTRRGR